MIKYIKKGGIKILNHRGWSHHVGQNIDSNQKNHDVQNGLFTQDLQECIDKSSFEKTWADLKIHLCKEFQV